MPHSRIAWNLAGNSNIGHSPARCFAASLFPRSSRAMTQSTKTGLPRGLGCFGHYTVSSGYLWLAAWWKLLSGLIKVVMDLGRKPLARFPSGDFVNRSISRFRILSTAQVLERCYGLMHCLFLLCKTMIDDALEFVGYWVYELCDQGASLVQICNPLFHQLCYFLSN
ncbi:hypothetical protein E2542_SST21866 [Spatholobus suberectus]|nr:hypothetical protein E2542_SST21866 [Spatholobus suberectus]